MKMPKEKEMKLKSVLIPNMSVATGMVAAGMQIVCAVQMDRMVA